MKKILRCILILSISLFTNFYAKSQQAPQYSNSQLKEKPYAELAEEFKYLFDNSLVPAEKQHRKYLRREMFEYLRSEERRVGKEC